MLTSHQILDAVTNLGQVTRGMPGRVEALRRAQRDGMTNGMTLAQERFLAALATAQPAPRTTYSHPADSAEVNGPVRGNRPLSPSELAWLQLLPADPTAVSFTDAQRVFGLLNSVANLDDRTLLRSIADPIREHHDWNRAEVEAKNADLPLVPAPTETLPALADALAVEVPHLEPDEVVTRAGVMLREHGQQRVLAHGATRARAQQNLMAVADAAAKRVAVHRIPVTAGGAR